MVEQPAVLVRGEAEHEVMPELARLSVTVAARGKDRQTVLTSLTDRAAALRTLLDGYGDTIERRETGGIIIRPEWRRGGEKVSAYTGAVTTNLTVADFSALGDLVIALAGRDQTTVAGPWWELRPNSPAQAVARRAAVADALVRAREYASAVGARLDRLVEIADDGAGGGPSVRMAMVRSAGRESAQPELDIDPQMQTVHAAVRLRFLITEPTHLGDDEPQDSSEPFTV
jgi:uncharacterized protein YggE